MKKLIIGIFLICSILLLGGCFRNNSITAVIALDQVWDGGFSYGIIKDGDSGTDLYKLKKIDFENGVLNLGIRYDGDKEREFSITPLLNSKRIKVDFNGKGLEDQYTTKIKKGDNKIKIKTDSLANGIVSFIFKSGDTCFGIYGYNNHSKIGDVMKDINYDELKEAKEGANEEIIGKKGEEVNYSFKVELPKERFEGDNYGYKVFLDDTLINIDDKNYKVFKDNKDIFEDEFRFKLPEKEGTYDLYIFREVNPIDEIQPTGSIVFKTKVIVE
ncbi:hypothetical protein K5V21_14405 [Clostridium sardiniense]|uniref:Lipoprotein n=1 Tax=Clostridium sardiniense TaxID=29369 RepID=A0ABS7L1B6_CLOSR|nr:hypothetical protein [Clostridium sardiniense]MBY0756637.1 hypothetical protein [Clostridium sardiniense]MDQ0458617.1 hypothetical protein [Clostridium sardiniense]